MQSYSFNLSATGTNPNTTTEIFDLPIIPGARIVMMQTNVEVSRTVLPAITRRVAAISYCRVFNANAALGVLGFPPGQIFISSENTWYGSIPLSDSGFRFSFTAAVCDEAYVPDANTQWLYRLNFNLEFGEQGRPSDFQREGLNPKYPYLDI